MPRKLKILMVNKYYFIKGGAERYFFELTKVLESHGHEVIPFSMKHPNNYQTGFEEYFVSNIEFNHTSKIKKLMNSPAFAGRIIYSTSAKKKIEKLIKAVQPDIAHLHMIDHQLSASILHTLKKHNIPTIQTIHQYKLICPNYRLFNNNTNVICEKCMGGKYYHTIIQNCHKTRFSSVLLCVEAYVNKLMKIYEKNIDLFHTPSDFMKEKLVEGGIKNEKIEKLYYTLNLDEFGFSPEYADYFIYSGRLSEEKGVLTLLKAMEGISNSRLLVVGDGPLKSELEAFAKSKNLENVQFVGKKDGDELKSIIKKAKFVVIPSEWYDNSPLVIYESFSMGKPVIGSDIGGISELINHNDNGLLVKPGGVEGLRNGILHLLENPKLVKKFGKHARKKAEAEFDPQVHYNKILNFYSTLIEQ
ncbi:glycosyltransferase family 4 protein [candidate division KSB1 bacterium]|nr:glycosyltransferase family 4 protein [candidate division KSB1 bacterium]